ncbi:hypothetical protein HDU77_008985 [Chytriomyces hyalinus]|nr:hypothetical protein HDU77_008985 [Chytriomyces hyalinus]
MSSDSSLIDTQFRTAALAVANLYRTSQQQRNAAYDEGYAACFDQLIAVLSVAVGGGESTAAGEVVNSGSGVARENEGAGGEKGNDSKLVTALVHFFNAKQDCLLPSSAVSLEHLVTVCQSTRDESHENSFNHNANTITNPPVFTFNAAIPSETTSDSLYKQALNRVRTSRRSIPSTAADNDFTAAMFSGVDFNALALGASSNLPADMRRSFVSTPTLAREDGTVALGAPNTSGVSMKRRWNELAHAWGSQVESSVSGEGHTGGQEGALTTNLDDVDEMEDDGCSANKRIRWRHLDANSGMSD